MCDAEPSSPPLRPIINVAHCIVGVANINRPFYSRPFTHEETWQSVANWLLALKRVGIRSGAYLVLDTTEYPGKPRRAVDGLRPYDILIRERFPLLDAEDCRESNASRWIRDRQCQPAASAARPAVEARSL